jgi:DNA-binding transcriptional LysR family regulator
MAIEIRQLRYAVLTADTQSFSRAATALNVKQSTLSRRVAGLEHRLGIQLFERSTRGAVPTEYGKAFLSVARRILTDVDNLQTTARAVSYGEEGRIAVGFSASLMTGSMRATIADFMHRHPNIQFDGIEAQPDKLLSDLNARIVDVAVVPSDISDGGISRRSAWSERLLLALPNGHHLLDSERIHWSDLCREVFVLPRQGVGAALAGLLKRRLGDQGYRTNIIMQDTSLESVLSTVSIGRYITIATEASLGVTWPDIEFREIYDQNWPVRLDFALYWRDDNENPALKQFFKLINERYPA